MTALSTKLIFAAAARNNDLEPWMNILFLVVLAVVWAIGGFIKAKTRAPEDEDDQQAPRKPGQKPPARGRGLQEMLLRQLYGPARPAQTTISSQRPTAPPRTCPCPAPRAQIRYSTPPNQPPPNHGTPPRTTIATGDPPGSARHTAATRFSDPNCHRFRNTAHRSCSTSTRTRAPN